MGDVALDAAQALLTGLDTAMSKQWREEDRTWRKEDRSWRNQDRDWRREDLDWRLEERMWREHEADFREENRQWRREDMEQRHLDNARALWARYVEKNRRAVEEKSEQLKAVSSLAALIAGFAVVAIVELNFATDDVSQVIMLIFGASTAVTVALMTNSMVSCSLMLATILKNGKTYVSEEEEAQYIKRCRRWVKHYRPGDQPPAPQRTFSNHWQQRFEDDWKLAFRMFTLGVPCFMSNLGFAAWLKFPHHPPTAATISAVMFVSFLVWLKSHYSWAWYLMKDKHHTDFGPHVPDGLPFDWHANPVRKPGASRSRRGGGGANGEAASIAGSVADFEITPERGSQHGEFESWSNFEMGAAAASGGGPAGSGGGRPQGINDGTLLSTPSQDLGGMASGGSVPDAGDKAAGESTGGKPVSTSTVPGWDLGGSLFAGLMGRDGQETAGHGGTGV